MTTILLISLISALVLFLGASAAVYFKNEKELKILKEQVGLRLDLEDALRNKILKMEAEKAVKQNEYDLIEKMNSMLKDASGHNLAFSFNLLVKLKELVEEADEMIKIKFDYEYARKLEDEMIGKAKLLDKKYFICDSCGHVEMHKPESDQSTCSYCNSEIVKKKFLN